ncbi:large conductance mechanosensitive channel protein MscL [Ihubacter sp. rT4E-8]|uniref:large conductance mechanosensitive channel protein MscL n=1 Tax=Ihubacter sp. rT4E-8 TaxID=3242369 RepID=UPI003CEB200C
MKKFLSEFKEFIARGDVMSMAIGIIIGGAFTAIVNSLVGDIITPILGIVIGGLDFTNIVITVGSAKIMVGNFIQAIIVFLLTALVIFSMMKVFNNFMKKKEDKPSEAEPETPADIALLTEIRDLLKSKNN